MYLLDTNILIFAMKQKLPQVVQRMLECKSADICISSITYGELCCGIEKSHAIEKNRLALTLILSSIQIMPFDSKAAEEYGRIRAYLEKRGLPIGPMDELIAAHAKSLGHVLVTNNVKEFQRVPNLMVEDWSIA